MMPGLSVEEAGFLREAIRLAEQGALAKAGGPFGAVVVRAGAVVGRGWNQVTSRNDPTAHAEVVALRAAGQALGDFRLRGCVLYASCEPCPMCWAAAYWARVDRVVYGAGREEAAAIGFDDARLYEELGRAREDRALRMEQALREEAAAMMRRWAAWPGRIPY